MDEQVDGPLQLRALLWAPKEPWSQELVEKLAEDFADWLIERGFTNSDGIHSLITLGNVEDFDGVEEFVQQLTDDPATQMLLIPNPEDPASPDEQARVES